MPTKEGQVGPQIYDEGDINSIRMTKLGAQVVQQFHGRFYEQCYRGNLFSFAITQTAFQGAVNASSTTGATAAPIIGLWNPFTSPVNLVVLQVTINVCFLSNSCPAPGGFNYMVSTGNAAISTGSTPINCKTLTATGSFAKAYAINTALTGMAGTLGLLRPTPITTLNAAGAATAVSVIPTVITDNVDGSIIVPPGGVLAVMTVNTTSTAVGGNSSIVWEEVPV